MIRFGLSQALQTRPTLHKNGTGSGSDRVQALLPSTSNVQINWFIDSTTF